MSANTQYAGILTPTGSDIADEPFTLSAIAYGIDTAWGGVFSDFSPTLNQGAGATKYITLATTTWARVRKVGKTVYYAARLDVQTGTGSAGAASASIPYPALTVDEPLGQVFCARGGAFSVNNWGICFANSDLLTVNCQNGVSSLAANDFVCYLLTYETSG